MVLLRGLSRDEQQRRLGLADDAAPLPRLPKAGRLPPVQAARIAAGCPHETRATAGPRARRLGPERRSRHPAPGERGLPRPAHPQALSVPAFDGRRAPSRRGLGLRAPAPNPSPDRLPRHCAGPGAGSDRHAGAGPDQPGLERVLLPRGVPRFRRPTTQVAASEARTRQMQRARPRPPSGSSLRSPHAHEARPELLLSRAHVKPRPISAQLVDQPDDSHAAGSPQSRLGLGRCPREPCRPDAHPA
mmetsp:Transcript_12953/g.30559  ORF Transcript_12953/g.30559 Transcript_12953/m.30559 type:complete len:245 (+) Transcript_12953:1138-1872(+)